MAAVRSPRPPKTHVSQPRALPEKTRATGVGIDGLGDRAQQVLRAVRGLPGWVSVGQIAAVVGVAPQVPRSHLQQLVARGLVEAQGETVARRYRAAVEDNGASGGGERLAIAAPRSVPAAASSDSSSSSEEAKPEQPRRRGRPPADMPAAERRIARARILDHCSRRKLDEQSLATTLNVGREVVADICGELLLNDKIVLHADGRYEVPA